MNITKEASRFYAVIPDAFWKRFFPNVVHIEPVAGCNLKCPGCPSSRLEREKGMMKLKDYKVIIEKLPSTSKYLNLFFMGEPLLHPHLKEMIEIGNKRGLYTKIATNSILLKDNYKDVIDSGIDEVKISLDGFSDSSLQSYRTGTKYTTQHIKEGIEAVCQYRTEQNSKTLLNVGVLMFKHVEKEIDSIVSFCKNSGIDSVFLIKPVTHWRGVTVDIPVAKGFKRMKENYCMKPLSSVIIDNKGKIGICCYDVETDVYNQSLLENDFDEIFWTKDTREKRKKAIKMSLEICNGCQQESNAVEVVY
jgi:MoaA/NifB/PqqE/SkfB family radical SAM enzyme